MIGTTVIGMTVVENYFAKYVYNAWKSRVRNASVGPKRRIHGNAGDRFYWVVAKPPVSI